MLLQSSATHLTAENKSSGTVDSYLTDTHHLLTAMGATDDGALTAVDKRTIEKALAGWIAAGLAPATVARAGSARCSSSSAGSKPRTSSPRPTRWRR